jgi:hypothetical protein
VCACYSRGWKSWGQLKTNCQTLMMCQDFASQNLILFFKKEFWVWSKVIFWIRFKCRGHEGSSNFLFSIVSWLVGCRLFFCHPPIKSVAKWMCWI